MEKKYIADVYVGIETGPHGTFSAVVLSGNEPDSMNNAVDQLEEALGVHEGDEDDCFDFDWNIFRCQIPDSLVEQIRKDAVKDYLKQVIP